MMSFFYLDMLSIFVYVVSLFLYKVIFDHYMLCIFLSYDVTL